jgi:hypothetical protein
MSTFGFSAFLKMLSLNDRPQRTAMRSRLLPSSGSGYDFHRQFRLLAHRYLSGGEALADLLEEADALGNEAEGRAAREALLFLEGWRSDFPGRLFDFSPCVWESPNRLFKVRYTPDFGIEIGGVRVGVHIWKTQRPPLDARMTYAALSLFPELYAGQDDGPEDLAVLSVITGRLYRLSDVPDQTVLADRVVQFVENLIEDLTDEISPPPAPEDRPGDRP